jgi:hypothetical protein
MSSIVTVLFKLLKILNLQKIPYMLVGGFAVNYYGTPRATGDIDISLLVNSDNIINLIKAFKKQKFILHEKDILMLLKISNHFLVYDAKNIYRVDCWLPKTDFELKALSRRKKARLLGKNVYLPAVEDLILFKLLAGREKDLEDLKWIFKRQGAKLDKKYLNFWSLALGIHQELETFQKLKPL